jgi:glycosyltransferase involved in cell wall biosynthesis
MSGALAYLVSRYPAVSHTFILREVLALRARGLRIEVASVNPPDRRDTEMGPEERDEASRVYGLKHRGLRDALPALLWALATRPLALARTLVQSLSFGRGLRRFYAIAYAVEAAMLCRWMQARELQHLHVHFGNAAASVGVLAKTLSGCGLSLTIHGPDEFDDVFGQQLPAKVAAADRVVCISQFARSQLMRLCAPVQWPKLAVCRLGVDTRRYAPRASATARPPLPRRRLRLLCVGRLAPAKGQQLLLQACARLQGEGLDFELRLVGDGPDRAPLEHALQALGLSGRVSLLGARNQSEVREELALADLFVLPSLAEGIPVVLMEAMAFGLPTLSTTVNGIPELIRDGETGLLVSPGDVSALCAALRRLLTEPTLRATLAGHGRRQVRAHFELDRNLARLAEIFAGLPHVQPSGARA